MPANHDDISDSDRTALDELRADREFEKRLDERSRARRDEIRGWSQWVLTIILGALVLWDRLAAMFQHKEP